jgi:hypothetical protein
MTPDPLTAALDQLAACREHLSSLDTREAAHFAELRAQTAQLAGMITTISRALAEDTAALARLDALDHQVAELAAKLTGRGEHGENNDDGYQPRPATSWWTLPAGERRAPVAELRDWVEHVYGPGYGHLAALGTCWPEHDLCLYVLDIASQLWCALYLQPQRSTGLLSAQAEYQVRILPALAAQLAAETSSCSHAPPPATPEHADDQQGPEPGTGLRQARGSCLPVPARQEDARHLPWVPRRQHQPGPDP